MDEGQTEKLRMEIVEKGLVFAAIQYVEVYLPLMFCTCAIEIVKFCISLFLLLANLCFQMVSVLVKTRLVLRMSYTLKAYLKSSVTRFLTVC